MDGTVCGLKYNGTAYYFYKNLQGDVIGIANNNGTIGTYSYDAWGNPIGTNTAGSAEDALLATNPLRYRGYIYDTETGFYYLQSRYYDSNTGRFLNADDVRFIGATGTVLSANLFTYCKNDSLNRIDYSGHYDYRFIYDQDDESCANMEFFNGCTIGDNGCGVVAVYNVMAWSSNMIPFPLVLKQIKSEIPKFGGLKNFLCAFTGYLSSRLLISNFILLHKMYDTYGKFGLSVFTMNSYLETRYKSVECVFLPGENSSKIKKIDNKTAVIISYMRSNGTCHYVAGVPLYIDDKRFYRFLNDDNKNDYTDSSSVNQYLNILRNKKYTILSVTIIKNRKGNW